MLYHGSPWVNFRFLTYQSHYIADQNILVASAIVRKLQLSEFEVSKRGSICSFHRKGRHWFALCVKCRRQINNGWSLAKIARFKTSNSIRKIGASVIEHLARANSVYPGRSHLSQRKTTTTVESTHTRVSSRGKLCDFS